MKECKSLSHTRWDCKYHVVFIPKYRSPLVQSERIWERFSTSWRDKKRPGFWRALDA